MAKKICIVLILIVLSLLAYMGCRYLILQVPTASFFPKGIVLSQKVLAPPKTLTYADPDYPFYFDYPSFATYEGKINPISTRDTTAINEVRPGVVKLVTVGVEDKNGWLNGITFSVQKVDEDLRNWINKNYPACGYRLKLAEGGFEVVFSNIGDPNDEEFTPCFAGSNKYFYNSEKGFVVSGGVGHAVNIDDDRGYKPCPEEYCPSTDVLIVKSLRLAPKPQDAVAQPLPPRDNALARFQKTHMEDKAGPYKKLTISDGEVVFSFEVPETWFTELRNSGEVVMNETEMRDFWATNYFVDLKTTGSDGPAGDYWDFIWSDLEKKSFDELGDLFDQMSENGTRPGVPNASVAEGNLIRYTDMNHGQIDFSIAKNTELQTRYQWAYQALQSKDAVNGMTNNIPYKKITSVVDDNDYDPSAGGAYVSVPLNSEKTLIINKQRSLNSDGDKAFEHLIDTLQIGDAIELDAEKVNKAK
jgi:hypothetical protein